MSTPDTKLPPAAKLDFNCLSDGCEGVVGFDLASVADPDFQAVCPVCHRAYALLLTRLNTMITLEASGHKIDFHLWVEPSNPQVFR